MMDLGKLANRVTRTADGWWTAGSVGSVSYPTEGNGACFEIEDQSFWFAHRNVAIERLLDDYPPGGIVADIGGGNGYVARGLEERGHDVVLVEPGPEGVKNAVQRGLQNVVLGTLEEADFQDECFGGAGLFDVIEHVEDDVGILKAVARTVRTNGRLYLTVPACRLLWSHEDVAAGHYRRYSAKHLRDVCSRAGFEVEFLTGLFAFLPLPMMLMRGVPTLLGRQPEVKMAVAKREHQPSRWLAGGLRRLLDWEISRIEQKRSIPIGASWLVVARKMS